MKRVAIIGLGYVGLPLAIEFGKKFYTIGYDIDKSRVKKLSRFIDDNKEVKKNSFKDSKYLNFSSKLNSIKNSNYFIITLPTPINKRKLPDMKSIISFSKTLGKILKKGDIVIYESTVYPGATNELFTPILEKNSNLKEGKDFFCAYSPERINPGDKENTLRKINKVISSNNPNTLNSIDRLYKSIGIKTYKTPNILVAEFSKLLENIQRDVNIALINEFTKISNSFNVSIYDILNAASSKWNFLKFFPGLVGGHCIKVDPYYLINASKKRNIESNLILTARKVNESMPSYIFKNFITNLKLKKINLDKAKIVILGYTFKEDCSDIRNSLVYDLIIKLKKKISNISVYDPLVSDEKLLPKKIKSNFIKTLTNNKYDGMIIINSHSVFKNFSNNQIINFCKKNHVIYDLKKTFPLITKSMTF